MEGTLTASSCQRALETTPGLPARVGNNAGQGGRWQYYGTIVVRTDNEDIEVDYLDVDHMISTQNSN